MMKPVFIFPGQGSQSVGMGVSLAESFPVAADIFKRAGAVAGYDVLALCAEGPAEKLSRTLHTQPALFTVEAAIVDTLRMKGIEPSAAAGHSLGEYGAWYAAGVYDFESGFALVSERARLMDGADPEGRGGMAAVIGLDENLVREICEAAEGTVAVANLNSPGQVVISGERGAIERITPNFKERGAKRVLPLSVSGAFHSPLMADARDAFSVAVARTALSNARCPVYANVTAKPVTRAEDIRELMVNQLTSSVRWMETVRAISADGHSTGWELGPGSVLAGLVKRTVDTFEVRPVSEPAHIAEVSHETA